MITLSQAYKVCRRKGCTIGILSTNAIRSKFLLSYEERNAIDKDKIRAHLVLYINEMHEVPLRIGETDRKKNAIPSGVQIDPKTGLVKAYLYIIARGHHERFYTMRGAYVYATSLEKAERFLIDHKYLWVERNTYRLDIECAKEEFITSVNLKDI